MSIKNIILSVFCLALVSFLSACLEPMDLDKFFNDDKVQEKLERDRVTLHDESGDGLKAGNKQITGLKNNRYYHVKVRVLNPASASLIVPFDDPAPDPDPDPDPDPVPDPDPDPGNGGGTVTPPVNPGTWEYMFVNSAGGLTEEFTEIGLVSGGVIPNLENHNEYTVIAAEPLKGTIALSQGGNTVNRTAGDNGITIPSAEAFSFTRSSFVSATNTNTIKLISIEHDGTSTNTSLSVSEITDSSPFQILRRQEKTDYLIAEYKGEEIVKFSILRVNITGDPVADGLVINVNFSVAGNADIRPDGGLNLFTGGFKVTIIDDEDDPLPDYNERTINLASGSDTLPNIDQGTYTIVIDAYIGSNKVATGVATDRVVDENGIGTATITLGMLFGKGTFTWDITLPDGLTVATFEIFESDGFTLISEAYQQDLLAGSGSTTGSVTIDSGEYIVRIFIDNGFNDDTILLDLLIYYGMNSDFTTELDPLAGDGEYRVTFDANGGTFTGGSTTRVVVVEENDFVERPASSDEPTQSGFTFAGWFDAAVGGDEWQFEGDTTPTPITDDVTIYAQWTPDAPTQYTVTFTPNGGTNTGALAISNEILINQNGTIPIQPVPTNPGHTFEGWFTSSSGGQKWIFETEGSATTVTTDIELFAQWTPDAPTQYTVTFNPTDGANTGSLASNDVVTVNDGGTIPNQPDPYLEDYDFDGWFDDEFAGDLWIFATDTVTGNMTLYARWTYNP